MNPLGNIKILFVAGFGPIVRDATDSPAMPINFARRKYREKKESTDIPPFESHRDVLH